MSQAPRVGWPAAVPSVLAPIPATVAGQVLARRWATRVDTDPDRPRGLSKVTLTR